MVKCSDFFSRGGCIFNCFAPHATAAAITVGLVHGYKPPVRVLTAGGSTLLIHFEKQGDGVSAPFLEGGVDTVYKGEFYWRR